MSSANSNLYKKLLGVGLGSALAISGAFLVSPSEGLINKAYKDPIGIITACRGHVDSTLKMGQTFTTDQCDAIFADDLVKHDKQLLSVVNVPFKSDYEHAAMLSFVYNVGIGKFKSSTMLTKLNNGNHAGACSELIKWARAGGQVMKGLVIRRTLEYRMCIGEVPLEIANEVSGKQ
jgi:lysozyme